MHQVQKPVVQVSPYQPAEDELPIVDFSIAEPAIVESSLAEQSSIEVPKLSLDETPSEYLCGKTG